MYKVIFYFVRGAALLMFLTSCAGTMYDRGKSHLNANQYSEAVRIFQMALKTQQEKAEVWRDLGIAYFKLGKQDSALAALQTAYLQAPNDGNAIFYLGAIYENKGNFAQAIDYYRQYTRVSRLKSMRRKIEKRLAVLSRWKMRAEIVSAIENERRIQPQAIPDSTVAVLHFDYLGRQENLNPLQKGLAELVSYDLSKVKALRVLERVRFHVLLDELKLAASGAVDSATAPRIGKLLGARTLVMGSFIEVGNAGQALRITSQLVKTQKDTLLLRPKAVTGNLDDFFQLEKNIVFNVLDQMNIVLTDEERTAIDARPTENLQALIAFSAGLDKEDQGLFAEAQGFYERAQSLDSQFDIAGNKIEAVNRLQQPVETLEEIADEQLDEITFENRARKRRLQASGDQVNAGALPGQDERDTIQESTGTEGFRGVPVNVEIVIPPGLKKKQ